jgi:hypothetical protein
VKVVIGFKERGVGGCDDGLEERVWRDWGWLDVDLVEEGAEDAKLYTHPELVVVGCSKFGDEWYLRAIQRAGSSGLPVLEEEQVSSRYRPAHCILSIALE